MIDSPDGDFGGDFDLPNALPGAADTSDRLITNFFGGKPIFFDNSFNMADFPWLNKEENEREPDPDNQSIFGDKLPWYTSNPFDGGRNLQAS